MILSSRKLSILLVSGLKHISGRRDRSKSISSYMLKNMRNQRVKLKLNITLNQLGNSHQRIMVKTEIEIPLVKRIKLRRAKALNRR
jgi:hypothetical protein